MVCDDLSQLLPAYALDQLSPAERRLVEEHVSGCDDCRTALADYLAAADSWLYAPAQLQTPVPLKAELLRRIRSVDTAERSVPGFRAWLARLFSSPGRRAIGLAVAMLILLIVTNVYWLSTLRQLEAQQTLLAGQAAGQQIALNLLTSGGRSIALKGDPAAPAAVGALIVAADQVDGVLLVNALPTLPVDKTYQLWLIHDGQRDSAGLFKVDATGQGTLVVHASRPLLNYDAVGVTIEPAGGSPAPTSPRIIGGPL
jgi:hypothetical protein